MSNTFSPRTDGTVGKVAVRSQAHAAHLTIPLMLDAGNDIQDNNPTGPEHTEGGDSPAQAPARHTPLAVAAAAAVAVAVPKSSGFVSAWLSFFLTEF